MQARNSGDANAWCRPSAPTSVSRIGFAKAHVLTAAAEAAPCGTSDPSTDHSATTTKSDVARTAELRNRTNRRQAVPIT